MRFIKFVLRYVFPVLLTCGCTSQALSTDKGSAKPPVAMSGDLLESHVWYDGPQKRTVWLNPGLVAEFRGGPAETSLLLRSYPQARVRQAHRSVRIWELPTLQFSDMASNNAVTSGPTSAVYSQVLHDAPVESGRMRSLPGNVIVYLNPDWDQNEVTHWIATRG